MEGRGRDFPLQVNGLELAVSVFEDLELDGSGLLECPPLGTARSLNVTMERAAGCAF